MLSNLFVAGCLFVAIGWCWDLVFPINKKIWTSSYVMFTVGLAMLSLSVLIFIIEFKGKKGAWSRFFDVFGKNPLFIYILAGFLPRLQRLIRLDDHNPATGAPIITAPLGWFYNHICYPLSEDVRNAAVAYALSLLLLYWLIAYTMDRKKIYIRV